ncbi:hypothetical protein Ae356Ps1_6273c [Pseudonocardia sp. Ae356_Ps1]|nr:hypothetical protein Ae356Ps1_6273c [Pseudonocardia sp. Ae356_Ps1]
MGGPTVTGVHPRSDRRPPYRRHRRCHQPEHPGVGGQGLPRRRGHGPDPLQTPPDPTAPVTRTESGEPCSRPDPVPGRASRRRTQTLARGGPVPLLSPPRAHHHRRDHRPEPHRNPPLTSTNTMEKAPCSQ